MQKLTSIYRSSKEEGLYLYLEKDSDINQLPEELKKRFGNAELAMTLLITPERKLARAKASAVLEAIENQGFYLQLPPTASDIYTWEIRQANNKLDQK
ncbi:MAG: YcgL domain-containing protein [Pseudomonadales bacterium]|nr:YcgL domain-containing protein [Pseudomonadales bacterium]